MRALITWGGWPGHEPDRVAALFRAMLEAEGCLLYTSPSPRDS